MTDQGSHRDEQDRRPLPATDEVIAVRDLPPGGAADMTVPEAHPPIDSSLVGAGDLPAAARRDFSDGSPQGMQNADASLTDSRADGLTDSATTRDDALISDDTAGPDPDSRPYRDPAPIVTLTPAPARAGFWPMAFGGAVAAALGAGASWWAVPHLPEAWRPVIASAVPAQAPGLSPQAEAAARSVATEAARAEIAAQTQTLTAEARRAATEATEAALAAVPPADVAVTEAAALDQQAQRIASLEAQLKNPAASPDTDALVARIAALEAGSATEPAATVPAAPATPPVSGTPPADDALAQLRTALADQASRIEALAARPVIDPAEAKAIADWQAEAGATRKAVTDAAGAAEARLKDAQAQADGLAAKVEDTIRKVEGAASIAALQGVLTTGDDGAGAAARLQAAGIQPPAPLTVPVPALTDLQRDFPDAARAGLRTALRAEGGQAGTGSGLANFLRAQTGARSVTPRSGNDPDAILSRAGAAVDKGDIPAALTEIASLPGPAQAAMSDWTAPAKAWAAARGALDSLQTTTATTTP